ncbi:MAG: hypothetical protein AAF682_22340 [Planctomycetota bacterium]
MNTRKMTFALPVAAALAGAAFAQTPTKGSPDTSGTDQRGYLPAPPAGGRNVPNLGMHQIKKDGPLISGAITLLPGTVAPQNPAPAGTVVGTLYLPDTAGNNTFANDDEFPLDLWFESSDPSGSLDGSVNFADGSPIHFNLHWPNHVDPRDDMFWLADEGIDPNSPTDDLEEILGEIIATGSKARVQEAVDILLGTNVSGALTNKAYLGFELIKIYGRQDNRTYDPETRNIEVTQLWYGTEIYTDANMMLVPMHEDYTITWKLRGLGDPGPNNEFAFPIDEFTAIPMKKTANANFWYRNNWIWKWFNSVDPQPGNERKFSLENLFELHTGTDAAPSYDQINPGDPRYWLHADRKFNLGSFVGESEITDLSKWQSFDLDLDGQIGGFLVDGTDTGLPYDGVSNPSAQFNVYGNNEYAVPLPDWSQGPYTIPYFGYDSSFTTLRKGQGIDLTIRYAQGLSQAGIYVWGWRQHPPRINWIETYSDGEYLASGAPKDWRFGHKWDEVEALGLAAIGDHAPELVIHDALLAFDASGGAQPDIDAFAAAVDGMMGFVRDRRGLPPTPDVLDFPNPTSDLNLLFTNLDIFGDRERISAAGKLNWTEGDTISITIHNDENFTRFFRVVDFGTTDYQYNGVDMGLLDWKPVWGAPQLAPGGWTNLFFSQGFDANFWDNTALEPLGGNSFYVDPAEDDPANFWHAGTRDLFHPFADITGFSGPSFHSVIDGDFTAWGNNLLAGKPTGDPNLWAYSYGKPIPANTTLTFQIEMPRSMPLNNGAMYLFDPQFHHAAIFTNHPDSELRPEGLDD